MREPAVAGAFYPANPFELKSLIQELDSQIDPKVIKRTPRKNFKIFIAPHAGYIYSGPIAVYTYKIMARQDVKNVIILGPAHTVAFSGLSLDPNQTWRIPGAVFNQNLKYLKALGDQPGFIVSEVPHVQEHSIEVQLPFLAYYLQTLPKITPIVVGQVTDFLYYAKKLKKILEEPKTVLVVSTDLSHYLPYELAIKVDSATISQLTENIVQKDTTPKLLNPEQACGAFGLNIATFIARELGLKPILLKYANSGDTAYDKSAVVGYMSMVIG